MFLFKLYFITCRAGSRMTCHAVCIFANGPAVSVSKRYPTRAPVCPGTLARKVSRCKEGTAQFLPSRCKLAWLYECRGTNKLNRRQIVWLQNAYKLALAQSRDVICLGANYLSWCRILIAGRGASPGLTVVTNLSWMQKQFAKTVTSLLTLPSVLYLGKGSNCPGSVICHDARNCLGVDL
jgi:hypothetical protein